MEILDLLKDIVIDELGQLKDKISANLTAKVINASGRLEASLEIQQTDDGGELLGNPYIYYTEHGRGPGKVPFQFTDTVKQWAIDKHLNITPIEYVRRESEKWKPKYTPQERGYNAFAGAVAYKIRTEGTKTYRDGGRTDIYTDDVETAIEKIKDRVELELNEFIINDLNKFL